MPLESLQYVLGVGAYRSVLKMYELSVRANAAELGLIRSRKGDDWWALSYRLKVPLIQLRLYNPFLNDQRLQQASHLIAYPRQPVEDLLDVTDDGRLDYRARIGDNYINLAFAFGVDLEQLATRFRTDPWQLVRDNHLWDQDVRPGMVLRVRQGSPAVTTASLPPVRRSPPRPTYAVHRVSRGDNLTTIARRYGTTIAAIQRANSLGRRTVIRIGDRLRIPTR